MRGHDARDLEVSHCQRNIGDVTSPTRAAADIDDRVELELVAIFTMAIGCQRDDPRRDSTPRARLFAFVSNSADFAFRAKKLGDRLSCTDLPTLRSI